MQTIVVASSAASALGYTSYLRQNYPQLRIGVSLSYSEASKWGHSGFRRVKFPEKTIVNFDGTEIDVSEAVMINEASETSSGFLDDFQLYLNGIPSSNYRKQWHLMKAGMTVTEEEEFDQLPIGEKIIRCFQNDPIKGENVIDVLVTVGKAYEGLDAPRCKHLICLTRQRSAPWLAQCFARAWRRDYSLQTNLGITEQRCWIFAPRDALMLDAVDRIVWDQDLAPIIGVDKEESSDFDEEDTSLNIDDVLTPEQRQSYDEFKQEMQKSYEEDQIIFAEPMDDYTANEDDDSDVVVDVMAEEEQIAINYDERGDNEVSNNIGSVKRTVSAFSVIDRVIHEFVDDNSRKMQVLEDKRITAEEMLA